MEGDSGRDSSLLAAHREEGVAEGRAGSHPGHPEVGVLKAEYPADGTVRDHPRRSRHQLPSPIGRDREYSGDLRDTPLTRGGRDTPVKKADQRPDDTD